MDKTPEMVRRVAEAITANNGGEWHLWLDEARAAIEAMRDVEFRVADSGGVIHEVRGEPMSVWRFLHDAALASPEEPEAVGQDSLRTAPYEGEGL